VAGEAQPGQGTPSTPPANVVDAYWIRYNNRTFLNKDKGPMQFMLQDMPKYVKIGDENWSRWFGTDKSKWIFNTKCCATDKYYRMAQCKPAHTPSPGPSPPKPHPSPAPPTGTCKAAVEKTCPGESGETCMECCREHHGTLIKSCPEGREEMRKACGA